MARHGKGHIPRGPSGAKSAFRMTGVGFVGRTEAVLLFLACYRMLGVGQGLIRDSQYSFRCIDYPATLDHTFGMLTSLFGRCMSVSAVVCVLLMFLFPLPYGNFQSTHGPVTALRSMRAFLLLLFSVMSAAFQILTRLAPIILSKSGRFLWNLGHGWRLDPCRCSSSLRC